MNLRLEAAGVFAIVTLVSASLSRSGPPGEVDAAVCEVTWRSARPEGPSLRELGGARRYGTSGNGRPPFRNLRTMSLNIAGCSQAIEWPASATVAHWAPLT